jgi:HJR/Mrr/RecB family endonuclease
MARRRYYYEGDDSGWLVLIEEIGIKIGAIYLIWLVIEYFTNRQNFWRWLVYGLIVIAGFITFKFLWKEVKYHLEQRHFNDLLAKLKNSGREEYLKNFIDRFGLEKARGEGWSFRNHRFDWDRIDDLKRILGEEGITSDEEDVFRLLRFYIQEKEEKLTRESIKKEPQKFANLTGAEFENLLYRLFEKMGYAVEHIGKSGDQGGDLIANKGGERILIQAKCYRDWKVGNDAVQQVVAAQKFYNCNKTMVIIASEFTPEAISLAKANGTELIGKHRLQEMLLKYLGENWN